MLRPVVDTAEFSTRTSTFDVFEFYSCMTCSLHVLIPYRSCLNRCKVQLPGMAQRQASSSIATARTVKGRLVLTPPRATTYEAQLSGPAWVRLTPLVQSKINYDLDVADCNREHLRAICQKAFHLEYI
ncbi:hypothetical protein VTK56DRAFT_8165 [Thermocarpiscus australiensis]